MIVTYDNRDYRITYDGVSMVENALENPNLIQVSVVSGCTVMVAPNSYGVSYLPNGEYRSWNLSGYNTRLNKNDAHYIYARLNREGNNAMILFSVNDYAFDGKKAGDSSSAASEDFYYLKIGSITATDSEASLDREITFDGGYLSTPQAGDSSGWQEFFRITADNLIQALKHFASFVVEGTLSVVGKIVLNNKQITDIAREGDAELLSGSDEEIPTTAYLLGKYLTEIRKTFLNKDCEDQTNFLLKLLGGILTNNIESEGFTTGALGAGFTLKVDGDGRSYLEVDNALFRRSATFVELLIQSLRHVGGQIMLTPASMHCIRVEERPDSYRCFFESTDGDRTIANEFVVGDQARSQTFNIKEGVHENVKNTYYWRLVTAVGDDYIDLSKTDCDAGSGVPSAGDDIVQLGNRTDAERQAAIIQSSYGNDAPYFKLYRGIDSYDLTGKEFVSLSRSEVLIIADSIRLSTGETVKDYIDGMLGGLQIGGRNLILNSKLDNKDGWSVNYTGSIVEFGGYKCLKIEGAYHGLYTSPDRNSGNVPTEGVITNSVDVYATEECDIHFGCQDLPNTVHVTELNKWVRVHNTQAMDGKTHAYYVYGGEKTIYCKNVKCEKGSVATDWTPAPEDLENSVIAISEKVDTNFEVAQGLIKSEVESVKVMGMGSENIVKEGEYGKKDAAGTPGAVALYASLVKGNTYTAVLSGEVADGHRFELCDSGTWQTQGYFENVGGRIHLLRFEYDPQSTTTNHSQLYMRIDPEDGQTWDLDWICIYEGNVIPPYVFIPAPQEQESGSLDIGVRNLLLNSKLDNLEGWSRNIDANAAQIVVFDGYTCLRVSGNYRGLYTHPTQNARLIPADGVITSSIDVYATAVCDIVFGRQGLPNTVHITEANKWIRVHNTQTLDGTKDAFIIYTISETTTVYFKDAKCETGTVPTGWTPAPEDLKGFDGQNLVVRGRYGLTDVTSYNIRMVYLSKDLVVGKTYTAVLSGDVGGSQQLTLYDSLSINEQGAFTKKSGRIYTLTFKYNESSGAVRSTLSLYNVPSATCASNPADVDWLCIYEGAVDAPGMFVPAPEDDAELVAWGGHYGVEKESVTLEGHDALTQTGRGLHLYKLDVSHMKVTAVGTYDVYAATGEAKTRFTTDLNAITGDSIAIVTSQDAVTIDSSIQAALNDFGADAPELNQSRTSFVLVGKKGIGAGNGVMKTSSTSAVSVTVRIVEGVCRDFFGNGGFVTWKEETKTWIKETSDTISLHAEKITTMGGQVSEMESTLEILPGQISSKVSSTDFNGNNIVSRINQTDTTITIDASKINLVGKVSIGMLDKTIIENDKIKSDLISVNKIEAVEGTISGFEISSDHIGMAEGTAGGPEGLSLYSYRLSIGEPNCRAWIGSRIMSASSTYEAMAGRFEVNKSALGENIGIYISVQGGKAYNDTQDTGNAALHIAKGAIYGTRFRRRSLYASATISVMDTFIVVKNAGVRVTLPSSPEDGQFFFITNRSSGDITFYCASKLYAGNTSAKSSSANLQRGKAAFVYYDTTDSAYHCHWLGNWDN